MPAQLIPAALLVTLAVTAGLAFYYWRRTANLYALLVEGANRFEELRQRSGTLEQALGALEGKAKLHREATQRLSASLEEAREKAADLGRRLEQKEHEGRVISEKLELQKGHLERQLTKAQEMLRVVEEQRLAATEELATARTAEAGARRLAEQERAANAQELALKERDYQEKLLGSERDRAAQEKKAKATDAFEVKKLRRKIAQYERLYSSMKGLREMTEERNRNWEVALARLATHVLTTTGRGRLPVPREIGPLVGQALHLIGAQLIDDHAAPPSRGGAGVARGMEDEPVDELDSDLDDDPEEAGERPETAAGLAPERS